jgi:hypothetical protein
MDNRFYVNKGSANINIYADSDEMCTGGTIGAIYPREAFVTIGVVSPNQGVYFRKPGGVVGYGYMKWEDMQSGPLQIAFNYPNSYLQVTDPTTKRSEYVRTFYCRNTLTITKADGSSWGSVAAGQYVAIKDSDTVNRGIAGSDNPNSVLIGWCKSTNGNWYHIDGNGSDYGFVKIGLDIGSTYSTIPLYGSW